MTNEVDIKNKVSFEKFKRIYLSVTEREPSAVIYHPDIKGGVLYIDRYEIKMRPLFNADTKRLAKMYSDGFISLEWLERGIQLHKALEEFERGRYVR